jgi:methyl-accepting chemotaxis protein
MTLPGKNPKTLETVAATPDTLIDELREFVCREVRGARSEIARSRALIGEAVGQLNASFRSMEDQSRQQRATITALIGQDGSGSPGVRQFARAAGALIAELTQVLADDSRESVQTVELIDRMVSNLEGLFDALNGLQAERALELAMRSTFAVAQVRTRVEESAEREMNASIEARTKADALLERVEEINRSLAAGMAAIADCTGRIGDDVSSAVRFLQFEDIVAQSLGAAHMHLDRLQSINQDAVHLQALLANLAGSSDMRQRALDNLARDMRRKSETWQGALHKPVSQADLKAGDVELF